MNNNNLKILLLTMMGVSLIGIFSSYFNINLNDFITNLNAHETSKNYLMLKNPLTNDHILIQKGAKIKINNEQSMNFVAYNRILSDYNTETNSQILTVYGRNITSYNLSDIQHIRVYGNDHNYTFKFASLGAIISGAIPLVIAGLTGESEAMACALIAIPGGFTAGAALGRTIKLITDNSVYRDYSLNGPNSWVVTNY